MDDNDDDDAIWDELDSEDDDLTLSTRLSTASKAFELEEEDGVVLACPYLRDLLSLDPIDGATALGVSAMAVENKAARRRTTEKRVLVVPEDEVF